MLKNNPYMKAYLNTINESISKASIIKRERIANEIGGVYIPETNTIDCKGNKVEFKNNWLNDEGSFDFKLVNTSNNWSYMFRGCTQLTHLPDNFTIPNGVTNCSFMFAFCKSLTHLPDNFTIPNTVTNCCNMFYNCKNLSNIPTNFHIPSNTNYSLVFYGCNKLKNKNPEQYIMVEI